MTGEGYRHTQSLQYLANFPGARVEKDRIAVAIETADGPLDVSAATVPVNLDEPLDVSAATVPVSLDEPLDVSGATVPVEVTNDDPDPAGYEDPWAYSLHGGNYKGPQQFEGIGEVSYADFEVESDSPISQVLGAVTATGSYDVYLRQDASYAGGGLVTTELATGVAGGETTTIQEPAYSLTNQVLVVDASGSPDSQEVSGTVHVA